MELTVGILAVVGLMLGVALRPLFRVFVTIPIAIFLAKRIKSERVKRFLFQDIEAYKDH